ncbi:MAG TPA: homoserine O-succinyltransferase [Gammaproteobacteria bacterium]
MPLVAHNTLPSFARLSDQGIRVRDRAEPGLADLHIGFLNIMPDAALSATEQQYMRLIGSSDVAANVYFYPFTIGELGRGEEAMDYVRCHYFEFPELLDHGLHSMIITGANVIDPDLEKEAIWKPLIEVADWAYATTASTLCSCLASHALVKHSHDIDRRRLSRKHWGVYRHHVRERSHPLMAGVPSEFDAPHSRWNDISQEQLEAAGFTVLASGDDAGVHLAVSGDGFRVVFTQGHPEYDANSLLKEYKREVLRYFDGELEMPPPFPENYLPDAAKKIASRYVESFKNDAGEFPEDAMSPHTASSWDEAGGAIMSNWLDLVRRLANRDPKLQFADGVNPDDPLALRAPDARVTA